MPEAGGLISSLANDGDTDKDKSGRNHQQHMTIYQGRQAQETYLEQAAGFHDILGTQKEKRWLCITAWKWGLHPCRPIFASILRSVLPPKLSGAKGVHCPPEVTHCEEIEKQNRHRGVLRPPTARHGPMKRCGKRHHCDHLRSIKSRRARDSLFLRRRHGDRPR